MKCMVCKVADATEFNGPTGLPIKRGYCEHCRAALIRDVNPKRTKSDVRDLNRRGTEEAGRPAMHHSHFDADVFMGFD